MTETMNVATASARLVGLVRGIARDMGHREDLDTRAKCRETGARILELLEGRTVDFPAVSFLPVPHPDDRDFCREEETPWFDPDIAASGGMSELFRERLETEDWGEEAVEARPRSADEVRDAILRSVAASCYWWEAETRVADDADACDGVAFSTLASLSGTSLSLPQIDLHIEAEAIADHPGFDPMVLDEDLQSGFHQVEPISPGSEPDPAAAAGGPS